MAQITYTAIPYNWIAVSSIASTIEDGEIYFLESRGPGNIIIREDDSLPSNNEFGGILLDGHAYKIAVYKNAGKNLYVRLERSSLTAALNVTKKEA